jgi:hypothetical protein
MSYLCYLCLFEYSGVRCNIVHLINGLESKYNVSLKFNDKIQMLC